MVFLTSCWFIVEKVIIPDGYAKWFCLSYFIYPVILVFVPIFLFVEKLTGCLVLTVSYAVRFCRSLCEYGFRPARSLVVHVRSLLSGSDYDQYFDSIDSTDDDSQDAMAVDSSSCLSLVAVGRNGSPIAEEADLFEEIRHDFNEYAENIYEVSSENSLSPDHETFSHVDFNSESSDSSVDPIEHPSLNSVDHPSLDSPVREYCFITNSDGYFGSAPNLESPASELEPEQFDDPFYTEYADKMRWFDMLNHGYINSEMGAVFIKQAGSRKPRDPFGASIPFMAWQRASSKSLLKSLECEFERIYVAQLCLSWEALHHQYRMVEDYLANSSTQHGFFDTNVAGEFQKFHVILNRFMEDEWNQGKRYLNYVQRRFSDKTFLQVPQLSGFYEEAKCGTMGEAMNDARQVLKAIAECVKTYCEFVKADNKYRWQKFIKSKLWSHPPVEDPSDLDLLAKLTRMLQLVNNKMYVSNSDVEFLKSSSFCCRRSFC
uniref:Uncharacterized protein n=1 Tax=Kalanchoe fedtschenkoi TaxID=63787 RepID=A0A7N0UB14_KALFE